MATINVYQYQVAQDGVLIEFVTVDSDVTTYTLSKSGYSEEPYGGNYINLICFVATEVSQRITITLNCTFGGSCGFTVYQSDMAGEQPSIIQILNESAEYEYNKTITFDTYIAHRQLYIITNYEYGVTGPFTADITISIASGNKLLMLIEQN